MRAVDGIQECETRAELKEWLEINLPGASLHDLDGEIIIHTGLEVTMGDYLSAIESEEE